MAGHILQNGPRGSLSIFQQSNFLQTKLLLQLLDQRVTQEIAGFTPAADLKR
jgi:hypothetical protein